MKTVLFLLLISISLYANPSYIITNVSGNAKIQNKNVKTKQKVQLNDIIRIYDNSSITINDTIKFSKVGDYSISKIIVMSSLKKSNVTSALAKSLLDELSSSDDLLISKGDMSQLGAVERSTIGNKGFISFPKSTHFINDTLLLTWKSNEPVDVIIRDDEDKIVFMRRYNSNSCYVNVNEFNMQYDVCYFWSISNNSAEYCLVRTTELPKTEMTDPIQLSLFYKENRFLIEYMNILKTLPIEIQEIIER